MIDLRFPQFNGCFNSATMSPKEYPYHETEKSLDVSYFLACMLLSLPYYLCKQGTEINMSYFKASLYALLTAPLILFNVSHASMITTGDLEYDDGTNIITNTITKQTYLGWDVLAGKTQDETQQLIDDGTHEGYHIADKFEAKAFFEAAIYQWFGVFTWDDYVLAMTEEVWTDGGFGANMTDKFDRARFIVDSDKQTCGHMEFSSDADLVGEEAYYDATSCSRVPHNSSWLLVANTTSSAVPVPAAIWLFGTALIGLVGYGKRKSKVPV